MIKACSPFAHFAVPTKIVVSAYRDHGGVSSNLSSNDGIGLVATGSGQLERSRDRRGEARFRACDLGSVVVVAEALINERPNAERIILLSPARCIGDPALVSTDLRNQGQSRHRAIGLVGRTLTYNGVRQEAGKE
jgi:hypothetical protein